MTATGCLSALSPGTIRNAPRRVALALIGPRTATFKWLASLSMQERNWLVPVLILIILILIFGVGGLIKGAIWAIIIALALIGAAVVWGYLKSNSRR